MSTSDILTKYEPVIGLECHVELRTKSKMFCSCSAEHFGVPANTHCCPVCLGLPGALPQANITAIEWCLKLGLALNCTINNNSHFDRKNYAYPDLPKGYQISQNEVPFCRDGWIDIVIPETGETRRIGIHRIHLEEDTAKLLHVQTDQGNKSQIDFNRSSVPLIEIVTEPDIHSAQEAKLYLTKLRDTVRYLGISTADMEKGAMRMEPNISLRPRGQKTLPPYKVEVKNINSFRFVVSAIDFELERQSKILETSTFPTQETRGWDADAKNTYTQRLKENAGDYRYFIEPDLPPMYFSPEQVEQLRSELPLHFEERAQKWISQYGVDLNASRLLMKNYRIADVLETLFEKAGEFKISPAQIATSLVNRKVVSALLDDSIFEQSEESVEAESERVLKQIQELYSFEEVDEAVIMSAIDAVLSSPSNAKTVDAYKSGKTQVIGVFIGQVIGSLKQKVHAAKIKTLLESRLQ